jgi:DNA mismatch repair ATPase MutS
MRPGAGCSQGKFYEIFEMDAHVAADILHLNAMRARRLGSRLPAVEDLA